MRRLGAIWLVVVALAASACGGARLGEPMTRPPGTHRTAPRTHLVYVRPIDRDGHRKSSYPVTARRHGSCFTSSLVVVGARRCLGGNDIEDPCWDVRGSHAGTRVLCNEEPWVHTVTLLTVSAEHGSTGGGRWSRPGVAARWLWALRLHDGTHCLRSQGASGYYRGRGVSYLCSHHRILFAGIDRRHRVWRVRTGTYTERDGYRLGPIGRVTRAWVGRA